jgi:hypothetical protein
VVKAYRIAFVPEHLVPLTVLKYFLGPVASLRAFDRNFLHFPFGSFRDAEETSCKAFFGFDYLDANVGFSCAHALSSFIVVMFLRFMMRLPNALRILFSPTWSPPSFPSGSGPPWIKTTLSNSAG